MAALVICYGSIGYKTHPADTQDKLTSSKYMVAELTVLVLSILVGGLLESAVTVMCGPIFGVVSAPIAPLSIDGSPLLDTGTEVDIIFTPKNIFIIIIIVCMLNNLIFIIILQYLAVNGFCLYGNALRLHLELRKRENVQTRCSRARG